MKIPWKSVTLLVGVLSVVAAARVYAAITQASTDVPKAIPDGNLAGVNSILNFAVAGTISDVNVTINITHTWDADILPKLTSPAATTVTLWQNCGTSGDNFTNTVIDDQAAAALCAGGAPPYTGSFQSSFGPTVMASFNGQSSGGVWTLNVADDSSICTGSLTGWSLTIDGAPPLPVELRSIDAN